ncbi:MAG TPA: hypothetical protein VK689_22010, partial [Armatimonadota bacterium]|nr:hypothetical protein [Armatimonadota bacterium]
LWTLANTYDLNMVADGYRMISGYWPLPFPQGNKLTLREALDLYVKRSHAHWRRDGAFLRVRRHRWYDMRLTEVPEHLVRRWAEYLRERRRFDLDDFASLWAALRDEQRRTFADMLRDEGITFQSDAMAFTEAPWPWDRGISAVLSAYGTLPAWQRQRLREGHPVPYSAMPPEARQQLHRALQPARPSMEANPLPADVVSGALLLSVRELKRAFTFRDGFWMLEYQIAGEARPRPAELGFQNDLDLKGTGSLWGTAKRPEGGGEALQQAYFLYRYGESRSKHMPLFVPWAVIHPPGTTIIDPNAAGRPD